ncbi:DUF11 domain-containing protein [Curtobacterium sp. MCPF17_002]|uniref:DUF11 domain-containing protein n=1 Tax=Curtobacterium sp. MCPF17_002 TaxID=2175645 RepID=UPI000DA91624|nr:DUF11 domain-containing protein [Curtobacterium sp. MCPF17_002]WIB77963.1 DUF11 domain-containing protein [Curtobacterium sp. MCPF17_002]
MMTTNHHVSSCDTGFVVPNEELGDQMTFRWPGTRKRSEQESGVGVLPALRSRRLRVAASVGALALTASTLAAATLLITPAAQAAAGDPFPASSPLVFVAQQQPTQLYQATTNASGVVQFAAEGAPAPTTYNGISYNQADDYLYGVGAGPGTAEFPLGSLIRVGQDGVLTRIGTGLVSTGAQNVGAFGDDGYLYTTSSGSLVANVTDVTTGDNVRTITLNQAPRVSDWTSADGYLWGISDGATSGPLIVRTDPATGTIVKFPAPAGITAESAFGAAWTFGNGNLGFSANDSGTVYQIAIANPGAAAPTFTLIATSDGPASSANDGAASTGLPTDLAIVKTGPAALTAGGTATYTLTVTNNGPGDSSGYVVNDTVPVPLTNVASPDAACTVTGNDISCVGGALANGATATYTVTASVPGDVAADVENTATVTSNEQDPVPGNNTSTTTAGIPGVALVKNAGEPVDVNGNGLVDTGDTIQYTFDVTNTGTVPLAGVTVNDAKVGDVVCPQTTLAAGATETCAAAAVYTITAADVANGSVDNTATVTGTTPDGNPITSTPSTTTTPTTTPAPGISIVKSATPSGTGTFTAGQEVTYSFTVTNTGNVPMTGVTVNEGDFSGTGELSDVACPATTLAVGAQEVCEATYTLTQGDVDAGSVTNSATAGGTPTGGTPITSTPSTVTVPTPAAPGISILKTASTAVVVSAGQEVTYSFRVTNTGNVTLTDVAPVEGAFNGSGDISAVDCPTTTLVPGQIITCTATYTVTQADIDAGDDLANTATATGTTPGGDPVDSTPSTSTVDITQSPALTVVKSSDADGIEVGQTVTYSFLVTNTGNVSITDPTVTDTDFSGSGELSAVTCPTGAVAPGDDVTCTATYTVTQADVDAGELTNTASATGTTPGGDPIDPVPSNEVTIVTDPVPALTVTKTADVEQVTQAGQVVTYSFLVANAGNVSVTDPVITDSNFSGHGDLSAITCPSDAVSLAPGDTVTCTATYTVVAADLADGGNLSNTATVTGTTPGGGPLTSTPSTVTVEEVTPVTPGDPTATPTPVPTPTDTPVPVAGGNTSGGNGGELAFTGTDLVAPGAALALLLMALGGTVLVLRRRKQLHSQDDNA